METYLYFSLLPESLIASMLPPEEFGNYLAIGSKKRTRGQAVYFEVDKNFTSDYFALNDIPEKCKPHPNGEPKKSVYISIYRVLENLPLSKLKKLYLTTDDGRVLSIEQKKYEPEVETGLHLYQEISPVTPRIAGSLNPVEFSRFVTDRSQNVSVPKIIFTELILDELAENPETGKAENLPYSNLEHLRDCLIELKQNKNKFTKTVIRNFPGNILYRTCKNGFFVGNGNEFLFYPFPSKEELEEKYFAWWHSALTVSFSF